MMYSYQRARCEDSLLSGPVIPGSSVNDTLFRGLVDESTTLVYIVDAESAIVVDVSAAALRTAGVSREMVVGWSARDLRISYPLQTAKDWQTFVLRASKPAGLTVSLELGKRGGGTFAAELHWIVREFGQRRYLVATGQVAQAMPRAHAQLERRNAWQAALLELATAPAGITGDLDPACSLLAAKTAEAMPCHRALVWLRETDSPFRLVAKGVDGANVPPLDQSIDFLNLLAAGRTVDLFSWPNANLKPITAAGVEACLVAPIRLGGKICGAITALHNQPRSWSAEDSAFAGMVAGQAAAALMSAQYLKVQMSIRESEERYRNFVQNAGEGIWRIEFPEPIPLDLPIDDQLNLFTTGVVAECNEALAKMGGFERVQDVLGLPLSAILPIPDRRAWEPLRKLAQAGYRGQDLPAFHVDRQGREHHLLRNVNGVVRDGCLVRLWGSSRDITQLKRAEDLVTNLARARSQDDFFRSLATHLAESLGADEVAVIGYAAKTGAPQVLARRVAGTFVEKTPDWLARLDLDATPAQTLAAKPLLDSQGASIGWLAARFRAGIEDRSIVDLALGAFAARAANELERTRYQEELQSSEHRYRSFVELSSESIWRVDLDVPLPPDFSEEEQVEHLLAHAYVAECNQATAAHLGFESPSQLLGVRLATILTSQLADQKRELLEIVRSGYRLTGQESWHIQPNGQRRWSRRSLIGIPEQGKIARLWGVSRDITLQKEMEHQVRSLSGRRQEILEAERSRISREIHDDLGQQLSALKMYLATLGQRMAGAESTAVAEAITLIDGAIASTRRVALDLRPPMLDHFGLPAALEAYIRDLGRTTGMVFDSDIQEDVTVAPGQALAIFRILQESLTNVLRHSGATKVMVTLIEEEFDLVLYVSDNGRGLVEPVSRFASHGLGLAGMRERASAYGGKLTVSSRPGRGATIEARFPIPRAAKTRVPA